MAELATKRITIRSRIRPRPALGTPRRSRARARITGTELLRLPETSGKRPGEAGHPTPACSMLPTDRLDQQILTDSKCRRAADRPDLERRTTRARDEVRDGG